MMSIFSLRALQTFGPFVPSNVFNSNREGLAGNAAVNIHNRNSMNNSNVILNVKLLATLNVHID